MDLEKIIESDFSRLVAISILRHNTPVKILAVSDEVVERLYNLCTNGHFKDIEIILSCGDLPYPYLENLVTLLNIPSFMSPATMTPPTCPNSPSPAQTAAQTLTSNWLAIRMS